MTVIVLEEGQDVSIAVLQREIDEQRAESESWGDALTEAEEKQHQLLESLAKVRLRVEEVRSRIKEYDGNVARLQAAVKILGGK